MLSEFCEASETWHWLSWHMVWKSSSLLFTNHQHTLRQTNHPKIGLISCSLTMKMNNDDRVALFTFLFICKSNNTAVPFPSTSSCKCQYAFIFASLRYQAGISHILLWMERTTTHTHTHSTLTDRDTHLSPYVITRHSTIQIHKLLGNRVGFSCIQLTVSEDFTTRHSAEVSDCGDRTVPQQNRSTMLSSATYFQPCYSR